MSNATVTETEILIEERRFYVTLTGAINILSDNGGIGPSIATVRITQLVRDGPEFAPTYTVYYDGHRQHSGFAHHITNNDLASLLANQAVVHGEVVEADVTIDLSDDEAVGVEGYRIDVILPGGIVADLWIFADGSTASVDVRKRETVNTATQAPLVRSLHIPSADRLNCLVAVLK